MAGRPSSTSGDIKGFHGILWCVTGKYVQGCADSHHISTIGVDSASRREAMAERDLKATDPAAHQPTKADMEEDVSVDATPDALAWAVTRGGAGRREDSEPQS